MAQNRNALGTVWNAWQTQWSGTTTTRTLPLWWTASIRASNGRPAIVRRTLTQEQGTQTRTGVQTSVVAQIDTESLGERLLSQALIPFIRARNVTFSVTGMKPLTRVYPFFDKNNVSAYVTPDGGSLGGNLVTSAAGKISGVFSIPDPNNNSNPRFRTGDRIFRLTSDAQNGEENVETFAQATYSATGILNTIQETIIATRNARVEVRDVSESQATTRTISQRNQVVGWWDPLAQSFMPQATGGEYVTKVDAFFAQKDDDLPVTLQIREMQNGYPTTKVLPFASKTLDPVDVNVSDTAAVATTFSFDEPVYVKDGVEYCIVLFTDSNKYLAWISRMGETDVGGNRMISEQPYLGVLFKSQNNTTWTAYDFEDLKFTLYRAKFDTSKTGIITLTNDELPVAKLESNPIRTVSGDSKVRVFHRNHNMHSSSNNVIITNVKSGIDSSLNGAILAADTTLSLTSSTGWPTSGTVYLKINNEVMSGTISGTSVTAISRGVEGSAVDHADGSEVLLYQINGIPLTEVNKTHTTIGDIRVDSYTVSTSTSATSSGVSGGVEATATENAQMDVLQTLVPTIEHPNTLLTSKTLSTSGTSVSGNQTSFTKQSISTADSIPLDDNYYFSAPRIICSRINETNELSGAKSFELRFTMTSNVDNLSPLIDLDRKTIVAIANRLDNIDSASDVYPQSDYVAPTEPDGDSNEAIYMTRKVQLKTPATAIKLLFDAVRFDSAEIQAMFKILRSDDASDFDEIGWQYFNTDGSPDTNVNSSVNNQDFIEREYTVEGLEEFIAFAVKIRMQGTNSSEPPRIKDLRAIALAT
jgi:hypothetical protein